jgi:hypothetical protein
MQIAAELRERSGVASSNKTRTALVNAHTGLIFEGRCWELNPVDSIGGM